VQVPGYVKIAVYFRQIQMNWTDLCIVLFIVVLKQTSQSHHITGTNSIHRQIINNEQNDAN